MNIRDKLRLYVITDPRLRDEVESAKLALEGGATAIQLRAKNKNARDVIDMGKRIRKITEEYDALFFVNDRVDIALAVYADGVHVGQSDIPPGIIKEIAPELLVGVSASSVKEARKAEIAGAAYIGAGSVFPTKTKTDAKFIGLDTLKEIVNAVNIPVVAIGGINHQNVKEVLNAGVAGIAVISAVVGADDVRDAAHRLSKIIQEHFKNL